MFSTKRQEEVVANAKQAATKRPKMAERAQQQLDIHFPNMPKAFLWSRKDNDGFITIPRTLPIAMEAIDKQTKGQPAGHTLFCLWARSPDHSLITIENQTTLAAETGFTGERAVDTWRKRMKKLRELGFIQTSPGPSGEFHYVLLMNPNAGVEWMRSQGNVQNDLYGRFIARLGEIGALGEIDAFWTTQKAALASQTAAQAQATQAVVVTPPPAAPPPPPPPPVPSPPTFASTNTQ
jgi:hypothetical protein